MKVKPAIRQLHKDNIAVRTQVSGLRTVRSSCPTAAKWPAHRPASFSRHARWRYRSQISKILGTRRANRPATRPQGIHAQAVGQLGSSIEFDERFENLGVDLFRGLVCTYILGAELLADPHDASPEFLFAEGVGGDVGFLANTDFADLDVFRVRFLKATSIKQ